MRAFTHPAVVAAIGVLLINDHLLKRVWPGQVTGKLSDFAGLAFFPLVVAVLIGPITRRYTMRAAALATGAWFLAIKTSALAAMWTEDLAALLVGSPTIIVVDPSDLIAIPAIWVSVRAWNRAPSDSTWTVRTAVLAVAWVATVATSPYIPPSILDVEVEDGVVVARGSRGAAESTDGGLRWREDFSAPTVHLPGGETEGCSADGSLCVRGSGSLVEERTEGGEWRTAWRFPSERYEFVDRLVREERHSVAVSDVAFLETDDGPVVFVAMDHDGLLRRDPSGRWDRDVTRIAPPLTLPGANNDRELGQAAAISLVVMWWIRSFLTRGSRTGPLLTGLATASVLLLPLVGSAVGPEGAAFGALAVGAGVIAWIGFLIETVRIVLYMNGGGRVRAALLVLVPFALFACLVVVDRLWSGGTIARLSDARLVGLGFVALAVAVTMLFQRTLGDELPVGVNVALVASERSGLGDRLWPAVGVTLVASVVSFLLFFPVYVLGAVVRAGVGLLISRWSGAGFWTSVGGALIMGAGPMGLGLFVAGRLGPDSRTRWKMAVVSGLEVILVLSGRSEPIWVVIVVAIAVTLIALHERAARSPRETMRWSLPE